MTPWGRTFGVLAGACLCLAAAGRLVLVAGADLFASTPTAERIEYALRLTPDNSALHALMGALHTVSDPRASRAEFEEALRLNPRDADAALNLALEAEAGGDTERAQRFFDAAKKVSRRFRPLWTRAGFEYRQGRTEQFWEWARAAANVEYATLTPIFQLCARTAEPAPEVLRRLALRNAGAVGSFLQFVLDGQDAAAVGAGARKLAVFRRDADAPLLFAACERLIREGLREDAVAVWNSLVEGGVVRLGRLNAANGAASANPACQPGPMRGFDWRAPGSEGVVIARTGSGGGFRITFAGTQLERVQVLEQALAVLPAARYQLRIEHQELPANARGLRWRVLAVPSGADLANRAPELMPQHLLSFTTDPDTELVRLVLEYERVPGTTRLADSLTLGSIAIARGTE